MKVCPYFQVHQPYRLAKEYTIFSIGKNAHYFDDKLNKAIMDKVSAKCYLPTNALLLKLIKQKNLRCAFSITGTALEQFSPDVLQSFQKLVDTGNVELLNETYYHSLSFLFDNKEFAHQVHQHKQAMKKTFGQTPKVFRNTELIYNNDVAHMAQALGFKGILAEGADHILGWRSPNYAYKSPSGLPVLLKNFKLSDDIAFRFSEKTWKEYPLTAQKYAHWLEQAPGDVVNLFMDYETFGEHQWADTGIFKFLEALPDALREKNITFTTPREAITKASAVLDIPHLISWADVERDVSAWVGNAMQDSALARLYQLKQHVQDLETWRKLTTSDHFYYMCTKWFNDGDVHKYFNPYDSPYECYITFMNALTDLAGRNKAEEWIQI